MEHPDIHPDIRKYWEIKGKIIRSVSTIMGDRDIIYYEIESEHNWVTVTDKNVIALYIYESIFPDFKRHFAYQICGQLYDETTALRLYKLLAFL